ncbi:hypothetical protein ACEZCY_20015 [Streptacidiphilus sp. N1-12]|uniref:DUF5666 domain-containing protein n=2 Tax=Streptacidiphilus alkalitolerans TaxID=3342712 RepID=A0ABV6WHH5_9ACTN
MVNADDPTTSPDESGATSGLAPVTMDGQPRRPWIRRLLSSRRSGWVVAAALLCAVVGLSVALATSPSATAGPRTGGGFGGGRAAAGGAPGGAAAPGGESGGGGSNARSGPAAGGSSGTVGSVSTSGFTLTTSAGQKVTVNEASSTTYEKGTTSTAAATATATSASAVTEGESVLVLGTTNGTTITATQVTVQPTGSGGSASSSGVVPFQQGAPSTAKQDGQIPANYTEGSGTIVSGTAANQATEAALAAYPGGVVDRVVQLSGGEYEVHYIGVNWPHHIFVDQNFKVVGAN